MVLPATGAHAVVDSRRAFAAGAGQQRTFTPTVHVHPVAIHAAVLNSRRVRLPPRKPVAATLPHTASAARYQRTTYYGVPTPSGPGDKEHRKGIVAVAGRQPGLALRSVRSVQRQGRGRLPPKTPSSSSATIGRRLTGGCMRACSMPNTSFSPSSLPILSF